MVLCSIDVSNLVGVGLSPYEENAEMLKTGHSVLLEVINCN